MNRRAVGLRLPGAARPGPWGLALVLLGLAGCMQPLTRPQAADEPERERYEVQTIGDISTVGNAETVALGGIGIVVNLDGAGGETVPEYRAPAERELQRNQDLFKEIKAATGVKTIKEFLNSPDVAVVLVSARLPAGTNKGDAVDVEVALPPKTKATSLRGGFLLECVLYNYDTTENLSPNYQGEQGVLRGHPVARAEGPILVGFGDGDEVMRSKRGRIWSGAHINMDWPLALVLNGDYQALRWVSQVADRVNDVFDGGLRGGNGMEIAKPRGDFAAVPIRIPAQYKLNQPHFLRVVRAIPLYKVADRIEGDGRSYRQRLAADLLDPARCIPAAIRLEALGQSSAPQLLPGLKSTHILVRFAAAQSLAYLNSPSAAGELATLIETQPALRAFALTALASLDESAAEARLLELLNTSTDDETRYGAFRALRTRNERNAAVRGQDMNDSFTLHCVAPKTPPLVHVSTTRRAEVVLFGDTPALAPPFRFLAGDFTVTADDGDDHCTVTRTPGNGNQDKRPCPLRLDDVLRAMASMGGTYPEAVELLKLADKCKCLNCRLRFNALPQATDIYDLMKAGKGELDILKTTTPDRHATPTLFDAGIRPHPE